MSDFGYRPLPSTEKQGPIHVALSVLLDPAIPYEHAEGNHNCGECWQCILGTVLLADVLRKEAARVLPQNEEI
jgi:hypothetical protein